jgi:hypothetical protein
MITAKPWAGVTGLDAGAAWASQPVQARVSAASACRRDRRSNKEKGRMGEGAVEDAVARGA